MEDDVRRKPALHEIGMVLDTMSVDEIDERIALLRGEIERLQAERVRKAAGREAAESVFKI
ncbi:DUF1192 domain-containing protein [Pelagibacterium montanilacus]|uniref:DUF1192 domain-containing protein n=1 Tax=Pelagibacterium montanilacus TaxID=2185280 RepID=UPI000F8E0925|nr:DUF1192 domain-containing protein [Pelagibacterium montanilacus]